MASKIGRWLLFIMLFSGACFANQAYVGYCSNGGTKVVTSGLNSTTSVMASYPGCTVTVNNLGGGLATIFSDNLGTPLSNPFQASLITGQFIFYANNARYSITLSGGTPLAFPLPVTITDVLLNDPASPLGCLSIPSLTGDVTSAGGTCATALPNIAAAGTGLKTTINAKGQVTGVTTAASTDLSDTAIIARLNAAANFGANPVTTGALVSTTGTFSGSISGTGATFTSEVAPSVTGVQLGDTAHRWDLFARNIDWSGTFSGGSLSVLSLAVTNNATIGGSLTVTGASTLSSVNTILYPTRGANSGSATGGIQEAINSLAGTQGMVFVDRNVTSTVAINMGANVDVVCSGKNVTIVFTGATDGFVWPNTANNSSVRNCTISAGNAASGKAINISDVAAAATNVKISDVLIASNNAPTTKWAYGYYCSNGIFETFDHVYIQTATIAVHGDGTCNANDFVDTIINDNLGSLTTAVEWQGGELRWTNGDIEGQFSNALAEITQPGASGSTAIFTATRFENHTGTGKGIHVNVGKFDCYGCRISIDAGAVANGFVIGDTNQTNDCKVVGGEGIGWTLGANASGNLITGYTWDNGITPVNNSAIASNNVFGNHAVGAGSTYAAEQMQEPIRAQAGTVAAPAYSFAAETGAGFYRTGANNIGVAFAGTEFIRLSNLIRQYSGGVVGWTSTADSTAAADTGFSRCGVATICAGNGSASDSSGTINAAAGTFTTLTGSGLVTLSGAGATNPMASINRLRANRGTNLVSGDFVVGAGWGNTATFAVAGTDQAFSATVTANGAGLAASPTLVLTFHDGTWTNIPVCVTQVGPQTGAVNAFQPTTITATQITLTWIGGAAPTAGLTYNTQVICMGKGN